MALPPSRANRARKSDQRLKAVFDVGATELFLLSLIGLLVLGPERLPAVARTLGGFVRKARLSYTNLKRTVEAEMAAADAANPVKQAREELESVQQQVSDLGKQLDQQLDAPSVSPDSDAHPLNPALGTDEQDPESAKDSGDADDSSVKNDFSDEDSAVHAQPPGKP